MPASCPGSRRCTPTPSPARRISRVFTVRAEATGELRERAGAAGADDESPDACGTSWARSASGQSKGVTDAPERKWPRASMRARSNHASPGVCQANVLCISLWIVSMNMLVSGCTAVDWRGCGKVGNHWANPPHQVAGFAVKGRTSGEWRTTPVNLLTHEGRRFLVAPRGETRCLMRKFALCKGPLWLPAALSAPAARAGPEGLHSRTGFA
jgi:hypothetical protein